MKLVIGKSQKMANQTNLLESQKIGVTDLLHLAINNLVLDANGMVSTKNTANQFPKNTNTVIDYFLQQSVSQL
jgi:hypothetical protein